TINGTLTADLTDIQGGSLSLGGMIDSILTLEDTTFTPTGQSATITGDLTLDSTSTSQFSIPTQATIVDGTFTSTVFDQLTVGGNITLGNSALAIQLGTGYPISSHSTLTILTSNGGLAGRFNNVSSGSRLTTLDGLGSFLVSLSGQTVQLSDFHTEPEPAAQFANLSTRGEVMSGEDVLIGGFILNGTENKNILFRALGPSLSQQGVSNPLADPTIELHDSTGGVIGFNNDWKDSQEFA